MSSSSFVSCRHAWGGMATQHVHSGQPIPALGSADLVETLGIIPNLITSTVTILHLGLCNIPLVKSKAGHLGFDMSGFPAVRCSPDDWPRSPDRDGVLPAHVLIDVESNFNNMITNMAREEAPHS